MDIVQFRIAYSSVMNQICGLIQTEIDGLFPEVENKFAVSNEHIPRLFSMILLIRIHLFACIVYLKLMDGKDFQICKYASIVFNR